MRNRVSIESDASLENIIHQYLDPYTFVRELAQNAIDAQLEAGVADPIEFWTEFDGYENSSIGVFNLHVEDRGTGMNKEDINRHFVQLFSSARAHDPDYIGEFGVGFVSVFAFEPDAMIVDTGKGGRSWRVIFKKNRKFDCIPIDGRVEGTKIQVLRELPKADVSSIRKRLKKTLRYWCRMANLEIRFDGERITEEFPFAGPLSWHIEGESPHFERLTIAPESEEQYTSEVFQHGLLLERGGQERYTLPGLCFRVDSKRIRCRPSRDAADRNEAFDAMMAAVRDAGRGPYLDFLVDQAAREPSDLAWGIIASRLSSLSRKQLKVGLIPAADGSKLSLSELASRVRDGAIHWSQQRRADLSVPLWDGKSPGLGSLLSNINQVSRTPVSRLANWFRTPPKVKLVEDT